MRNENHLTNACVEVLRQGVALLERLDDRLYREAGALPVRSGVGSHVRHCVDFYRSFFAGLASGRVDYNQRERDARVERDRAYAIRQLNEVIESLLDLPAEAGSTPLLVAPEDDEGAPTNDAAWCLSTAAREMQFLLSHTIHHFALIALMLRLQGFEPGAEFGVNPSTLKHWREAEAACAR